MQLPLLVGTGYCYGGTEEAHDILTRECVACDERRNGPAIRLGQVVLSSFYGLCPHYLDRYRFFNIHPFCWMWMMGVHPPIW